MNNLKLISSERRLFNVDNPRILVVHPEKNDIAYACTDKSVFELRSDTESAEELLPVEDVICCEYLVLSNELCCATGSGEVVVVDLTSQTKESVSFCEGGIETMSWSPDQEVVTFVTKLRNVVVMNYTYDPLHETSLDDTYFGNQEFIALGWGKKETQFHGSEGKEAAKNKDDVLVPANIETLDRSISVSWRGDSNFFSVCYLGTHGRMFKVFDKEGRLKFTSEKLNGLGIPIAWRPIGTWIAMPHEMPNKYTIALFEKNGLRHREIVLPFKSSEEEVVRLQWSSDSEVLAVQTLQNDKSCLYLYTMSNYHWYIKQYLNFDITINNLMWDSSQKNEKMLHILLSDGNYFKYKWGYTIYHSSDNSVNSQSVVSVIDGRRLLLTDFRNNVIPPPMYANALEEEDFINYCGFIKSPKDALEERWEGCNQFFIVDSMGTIKFYRILFEEFNEKKKLQNVELIKQLNLRKENDNSKSNRKYPLYQNHWLWLCSNQIIFCQYENGSTILYLCSFDLELESPAILNTLDSIKINGCIGNLTNISEEEILCHLTSGEVYTVKVINNSLDQLHLAYQLNEFCENIQALEYEGELKGVFLKNKQNLYLNTLRLASDVTSFYITDKYLIYTHLNKMKFMLLKNNNVVDERKIENGGKLIVVVPKAARTILQMPRGNLEAIEPRMLSLGIVGDYLDESEYLKAFEVLRRQRINLNILVDHNPKKFIKEIDHFLEEICNPQWLNLFLTELVNEDFSITLYSGNYGSRTVSYPEYYSIENKINYVCDQICDRMYIKNFRHFILPIITSYVKRNDLEKALDIIWCEKKKTNTNTEGANDLSEDALKYLLYLVDVDELYKVALGMYDFGLVLFVANKSQKDPKEYIPFLNELRTFDTNYRKFKIDEHLKRFERALVNLAKCGEEKFDECLDFVQKHKLYSKALMEFEANAKCYKKIASAFADHLRAEGKLSSASIMYERAGDLSQAIMSAKHVLDWRKCLVLTKKLYSNNEDELKSISCSLIPALQENGKYEEAAYLMITFGNDFRQAISILMKGALYVQAIYEAQLKENELIESVIKPHLETYKDVLQDTIESYKEEFIKFKTRLLTIRIEKEKSRLSEDHVEENIDECDLLSDVSTVNSSKYSGSSRSSGKTFRSSKNRRKHERKLLSLKEGNPFEDIALIDVLYNLSHKIYGQREHVGDICKALLEVSSDRDARQIQKSFADLLKTVNDSLDEIWIPEMMTGQQILGPNIDYVQIRNEQHYAMIKSHQRYKPEFVLFDWEHDILK